MRTLGIFFLLATTLAITHAYNILAVFPFNGKSHNIMFEALAVGLAKRGHQVDVITHFPLKNPPPNYREVVNLKGTARDVVNSFTLKYALSLNYHLIYQISSFFGRDVCELMALDRMQKFIKNPPRASYDLVIVEYFGSPCYLAFGPLFNATIALAISSAEYPAVDTFIGNPFNSAYYPNVVTDYPVISSFAERLENALGNVIFSRQFFYYTDDQTTLLRKYLRPDLPSVRELEGMTAVALVNAHHTFQGVRPLTQALVPVGGLHVSEDKSQLSEDLKVFMDAANDGVVYFTLGSLINIETLPEPQIRGLYASFAKIAPTKVLMKCANHSRLPPGLPKNILTRSWLPQIPILRHKNTRVFITHGGLMGSLEALHFGVPVIGIPVFADQLRNVNIFVHKGMGVRVLVDEISEASMDAALNAVLNDPSYVETAKRESARFRDRPMSAMDTAIFWLEYVVRNGPNSLRSPAMELPWWKLYLLDVYGFVALVAVLAIYLVKFVLKLACKLARGSSAKTDTRKRKLN